MIREQPASPGIYVHVPFCRRKCGYCDFYSVSAPQRIPDYISAVMHEMVLSGRLPRPADTLYLGGGTPSLLTPQQIERLLIQSADILGLAPDAEITLETNPATVSVNDLIACRGGGVNRLTIGVQSFQDHHLAVLGRMHSAAQACQALASSRQAKFDNVAIDLMYGLPGQTIREWRDDLHHAIAAGSEHISCYMLSLEPGTPLYAAVQAGHLRLPPEGLTADLFRIAQDCLGSAGYQQYEIANYARTNSLRSRHNLKYWNLAPYLGLGPSAHGFCTPRRWWNHRSLSLYLNDIANNRLPRSGEEILTAEQQSIEAIYLGLRQAEGIDTNEFRACHGVDLACAFAGVSDKYSIKGWIDRSGAQWRLTAEGMLFLDRIVTELIVRLD